MFKGKVNTTAFRNEIALYLQFFFTDFSDFR